MTFCVALSSLTLRTKFNKKILLAGPWCVNSSTEIYINENNRFLEVALSRDLSEDQLRLEANECFRLYKKYSAVIAQELNRLHSTNYSQRYWETLLNRFLYSLTAMVIDKNENLVYLKKKWPNSVLEIIDTRTHWISPHALPSLGASRLMHLIIYSVIAVTLKLFPCEVIHEKKLLEAIHIQGDGKKDLRSNPETKRKSYWFFEILRKIKWIAILIRALKRLELPFNLIRFLNPSVIALGNQYLKPKDYLSLMIRAKSLPFYYQANGWQGLNFVPYDSLLRNNLIFPSPETLLEESLQACIRRFLPTVFIENYSMAKKYTQEKLPKSPKLILNSQHHNGGEFVDFFIAHAVEERHAKHIMICHGGCYGAMEISVQEQVWAGFSDTYAIWSNPRNYGINCETIKLPSLRFHKWLKFPKIKKRGKKILVMLTGYYPQRYTYNSIYPYTIDDVYDSWQIRFLSEVKTILHCDIVIRDHHRSSNLGRGAVRKWADEHGIEVNAELSLWNALQESKIAIQTVPQTTYLETISANHPTLCFWNPKSNIIRADLMPYYDGLVRAGILHRTPESAAQKLNEIEFDPAQWWKSSEVQSAIIAFRENVCRTSHTALTEWANYIKGQKIE